MVATFSRHIVYLVVIMTHLCTDVADFYAVCVCGRVCFCSYVVKWACGNDKSCTFLYIDVCSEPFIASFLFSFLCIHVSHCCCIHWHGQWFTVCRVLV